MPILIADSPVLTIFVQVAAWVGVIYLAYDGWKRKRGRRG